MPADRYQVAVIGGGPAGAAAATTLARQGVATVVIERQRFPRFHVGESLLPLQGAVLERLGVAEKVARRGYVTKQGARFLSADGSCEQRIDFTAMTPPPHNSAYQVERADFDQLLLEHAVESGAELLSEHAVVEVQPAAGDCRLTVRHRDGGERQLRASWLIDASGQSSFLARKLGLRRVLPGLRKVSHFAHYEAIERRCGDEEGDIDLVLADNAWLWKIPLRDDRTSVGCVVDEARWRGAGCDAAGFLDRAIASSPWLRRAAAGARRTSDVHTLANFSYTSRRLAGDGWLLAGDAAAFLDPIFSTGVFLALTEGEMAAELLARSLRTGGSPGRRRLVRYERTVRRWIDRYFRLIRAFYAPGFAAVLFNPQPAAQRAVVQFMSGRLELPWRERLWLRLFYLLIRANRGGRLIADPRPPEHAVPHG